MQIMLILYLNSIQKSYPITLNLEWLCVKRYGCGGKTGGSGSGSDS